MVADDTTRTSTDSDSAPDTDPHTDPDAVADAQRQLDAAASRLPEGADVGLPAAWLVVDGPTASVLETVNSEVVIEWLVRRVARRRAIGKYAAVVALALLGMPLWLTLVLVAAVVVWHSHKLGQVQQLAEELVAACGTDAMVLLLAAERSGWVLSADSLRLRLDLVVRQLVRELQHTDVRCGTRGVHVWGCPHRPSNLDPNSNPQLLEVVASAETTAEVALVLRPLLRLVQLECPSDGPAVR